MFIPHGGKMTEKHNPKTGRVFYWLAGILLSVILCPGTPPLGAGFFNHFDKTGGPPLTAGLADLSGTPPLGAGSANLTGTPSLGVGFTHSFISNDNADSTKTPASPVILNRKTDTVNALPASSPSLGVGLVDSSGTPPLGVGKPDTSFWQRPTGALFKSIIFPGWGQYSNGKYQKAAIFFTIESFFIVKSVEYFKKTRDRFDQFHKTENRDDFFAYDDARSTRNKYYWYLAGTVFISMWDAFADAHIKPFEETKDKGDEFWGLEPGGKPDLSPPPLSLMLTIRF